LFCRHIAVEKVAVQTALGGHGPAKNCPAARISGRDRTEGPQYGHFPVKIDDPEPDLAFAAARMTQSKTSSSRCAPHLFAHRVSHRHPETRLRRLRNGPATRQVKAERSGRAVKCKTFEATARCPELDLVQQRLARSLESRFRCHVIQQYGTIGPNGRDASYRPTSTAT